jgi:two-component sensor histidine kinase/HAMP domain-containing protein
MRIKKRLQINIAATVLTIFFICLMLFLALYYVKKAIDASEIASGILSSAFELVTLRNDYLRNNSERAKVQWYDKSKENNRLEQLALEKFRDAEDRKTIDSMLKVHESIVKNFSALVENVRKREENTDSAALTHEVEDRLLSQLNIKVYEDVLLGRKLRTSASAHLFFVLMLSAGGILFVLLIIFMVVMVNSWMLARAITDRIDRLRDGASVIGGGNLDHRIDITGNDEFADLSETFNAMTAKLSGSYHDLENEIKERKWAEEALQKTHDELAKQVEERTRELREKEVLLKEVHHRVKNNLQVISSLVGLQADGSKDETVREVLRDVTHRVRSMALVHEKLYQSADLARIDFAEYARSLLSYLWRAHGAAAAAVRLTLDLETVSLPVDTAIPCGLILNELAGNALKHAFRGRSDGEVTVSLHGTANGLRLRVRDNGVGLPAGYDWRQAGSSLGLRLVQMLAGQLDGAVDVRDEEGTVFDIAFGYPK